MTKEKVRFALDKKGRKVVVINEILFYGRKSMPWDKVEEYLKKYIGQIVEVKDTGEIIHISADFPDEYVGSKDTMTAKGGNVKAKANAVQGVKAMINISRKTSETPNHKKRSRKKAKYGWFRYLTRFAIPVMNEKNIIERYNIYLATVIVRKSKSGKLYLYDFVNVKKEDSVEFFA